MAVDEGLHHVFRRDCLPNDLPPLDRGAAFNREIAWFFRWRLRGLQCEGYLVLVCGHAGAA